MRRSSWSQAVKEVVDVPVISGALQRHRTHRAYGRTDSGSGRDAVLVVMPYYSRPSQDGIVGHYKAVDESAEKRSSSTMFPAVPA